MKIYTDASTKNSLSGVAFIVTTNDDQEIYKKGITIRQSDNNTAELTAILFALTTIENSDLPPQHITILTDSTYAINAIRNRVYRDQEKQLMKQIYSKIKDKNIAIFHVKGHCQDGTVLSYYNNRADKLAKVVRGQYEKAIKNIIKTKSIMNRNKEL